MVEMKSGKVVLGLAARLASWRAVLVLLHTWATCKPWQREFFNQYSTTLSACLNHVKPTVWKSAGAGAATESGEVGRRRRKRRYTDGDGPAEPELGPHGPTLKKLSGLLRVDSDDSSEDLESKRRERGPWRKSRSDFDLASDLHCSVTCQYQSLGPAGSPSSIRKVANTARSSSSSSAAAAAATVPGWRSFFCLGNSK